MHYTSSSENVSEDYDAVGNLLHVQYQQKDDIAANETYHLTYTYDDFSRLTNFYYSLNDNTPANSKTYTYDSNGNILTFGAKTFNYQEEDSPNTGTYTNKLQSDGTRVFDYDGAGRMNSITNGGTTTSLGYDIFDNMITYGSHSYAYDDANVRLRKTEGSDSKYYINTGLQTLAEYGVNDELQSEYIHGNGRMIACYTPPNKGFAFYYVDHLGSTRRFEMSDEAQSHLRVNHYYPYGDIPEGEKEVAGDGAPGTDYLFTQKELDNGTGLYYFGSRYYDPRIGRWITTDPLADMYPSLSPYVYCAYKCIT